MSTAQRLVLDSSGLHYRDLNEEIRRACRTGYREIIIEGVNGQRYIGAGIRSDVRLVLRGTPGNNLASMMDGPTILVEGNAQDGVGNTMNGGFVKITGHAGDIVGYAMRGGCIVIRGNAGYRVGIHMKALGQDSGPCVIIGGRAGDFLGEYMAGGSLLLLGEGCGSGIPVGRYVGTGMHSGTIYIRGDIPAEQFSREVNIRSVLPRDSALLQKLLSLWSREFGGSVSDYDGQSFVEVTPLGYRPYGNLYAPC